LLLFTFFTVIFVNRFFLKFLWVDSRRFGGGFAFTTRWLLLLDILTITIGALD